MDKLKKARTPIRSSFTKTAHLLTTLLEDESPDKDQLHKALDKLERTGGELNTLDGKILELLLETEATDEDYSAEHESVEQYQDQLASLRYDVNNHLDIQTQGLGNAVSQVQISSGSSVSGPTTNSKRKFKLPKLELTKFNGDIKDWLGFWSQFKKIHEDDDIVPEDKFQYLIQATVKESRARELVDSFPATADNYPKVIHSLQTRFGRDDLLVEVYVREMLKLVIQNVSQAKEKIGMAKLYDRLESYLQALESLGVASDKYTAMLFPLVESCLPEEILRAWQRSGISQPGMGTGASSHQAKGRLRVLMDFLRTEVEGEERITLAREGFGSSTSSSKPTKKKVSDSVEDFSTAAGLLTAEKPNDKKRSNCIFCDKSHESRECFQAQRMSLADKKAKIATKKCCFACLRSGHPAKNCKAGVRCPICSRRHFALMCPDLPSHKEASKEPTDGSKATSEVVMANTSSPEVILQTLTVYLKGAAKKKVCRLILDSGSQRSYIVRSSAEEMGYEILAEESISHTLFGGLQPAPQRHRRYKVRMESLSGAFSCNFEALDQAVICGSIPRIERGPILKELHKEGVQLTDFGQECPKIEILIGADIVGKLLTGQVKSLKNGMVAVETKLGWTIMGKLPTPNVTSCLAHEVTSLFISNAAVSDLWSLDAIGIRDAVEVQSKTEIDQAVKEHFLETVQQTEDGRYEVHLPWILRHPVLPDNRRIAQQRLSSTTRKLEAVHRVKDYDAVFQDWLKQGIIEVVPPEEDEDSGHYLPHRAVIKEKSTTTPVRPVFDASAKEKNAPSLNDCLEKGPNLLELLPAIMMKFREQRIGVIADIRKAFLQISVRKEDRNYLRFLWWESDQTRKIVVLRHRRVVFGVNCSPFLLGAVINHHLEKTSQELQDTAKKLAKSLYVDNCVASFQDKSEVESFTCQAKALLSSAGFDLSGWESSMDPGNLNSKPVLVLGMLWNKQEDTLQCDLSDLKEVDAGIITKRAVLSAAHKIFDPIGFTCPVALKPKMLLQESWSLKVGWDAELPVEIAKPFLSWRKELPQLEDIKIPRWTLKDQPTAEACSLHTFCDASKGAYAAVVYLRAVSLQGVTIQLVQAKTRVAPLKKTTIPRLELLACCIGSRLVTSVKEALELQDVPSYYWTDSSTVLHWIRSNDQWGIFVSNRVKEINQLTNSKNWRHVPGEKNPADLPSRGCTVKQLEASRWWEGPAWLKLPEEDWPSTCEAGDEVEINAERKKAISSTLLAQNASDRWYLRYFSDYESIVRMVTWITRFGFNTLHPTNKKTGELTVSEIEAAETKLLLIVQQEAFQERDDSTLRHLRTFRDENGLLRIKTRIVYRKDAEDFRSPIVLPSDHPLVMLLIRRMHLQNCHAGLHFLITSLRERFWIVRVRQAIRKVITRCIPCRKLQGKPLEAVPAPLPPDRVRDAATFEIVGVDLAGPLFLKDEGKAWIVLFTCAVYRAVHLELVKSLSTEDFMQALRRFIARRGRPTVIYSDNGTNFVGTENVLSTMDWAKIRCHSSASRINWKFNPPTAAWWGGWWERLIGMLKQLIKRVLGRASINYDEMFTILCECEAVMNSRPLTYISNNAADLVPLTPAMFLQDIQQSGVPDFDVVNAESLRKRVRYRHKLKEDLQHRFRKEYLGQLIHGAGTRRTLRKIAVGDVVLVGADNVKRMDWPLATVLEVCPGKDGEVRLVRLKTSKGELLRPVQRLVPLEVAEEEQSSIRRRANEVQTQDRRGPAEACPVPVAQVHRGPAEACPDPEKQDHRGPAEACPDPEKQDHRGPAEACPDPDAKDRRGPAEACPDPDAKDRRGPVEAGADNDAKDAAVFNRRGRQIRKPKRLSL